MSIDKFAHVFPAMVTPMNEDGSFNVTLEITGKKGLVASVNMMVFTERQCTLLENNFRQNAEGIYQGMIDLLLKDITAREDGKK